MPEKSSPVPSSPQGKGTTSEEFLTALPSDLPYKAFDALLDPVIVKDRQSRIVWANKAFLALSGLTTADFGLRSESGQTPGHLSALYMQEDTRVFATGKPLYLPEAISYRLDGSIRHFSTVKTPVFLDPEATEGGPEYVVVICRDVTEIRRVQNELFSSYRVLKLRGGMNQALLRSQTRKELLTKACELLVEEGGYLMAYALDYDPETDDALLPVASWGYVEGYFDSTTLPVPVPLERKDGPPLHPALAAMDSLAPVFHENLMGLAAPGERQGPHGWLDHALTRGYVAAAALPLVSHGAPVGVLGCFAADTAPFGPEETALLEELTGALVHGLSKLASEEEHRATLAALLERETWYRTLYKSSPLQTFTWHAKGDQILLVDFNDAAHAATGGKAIAWRGRDATSVHRDQPEIVEALTGCLASGTPRKFELTGKDHVTGRRMHQHLTFSYVEPDFVLMQVEDVTTRKEAELALRRSHELVEREVEKRTAQLKAANERLTQEIRARAKDAEELSISSAKFQALFEFAPDGFFLVNQDGTMREVNQTAAAMLGYPKEELRNRSGKTLVPERGARFFPRLVKAMQRRENIRFTTEIRRADTTLFPADIHIRRIELGDAPLLLVSMRDVSAREAAKKALQESEARFQQIAGNIDAVFWLREVESRKLLYLSPAFEKIFGLSIPAVLEDVSLFWNAIHPEDRNSTYENAHDLECGDKEHTSSYRIVHPSGEVRHLRSRARIVRDSAGAPYRIAGITEDVTQRLRDNERLRESEETARALLNAPTEAAILVERDGRIVSSNELAAEFFGHSAEDFVGKNLRVLLPTALLEKHLSQIDALIATGEPSRSVDKVGERYLDTSYYPVFAKDGSVLRLALFSKDITRQVEAERKVRTLSLAVEQSPVSVVIMAPSREVLYVNPRFEEVTGYASEEAVGREPSFLTSGYHPDAFYAEVWRTISSGRTWKGEIQSRTKDGREIWESTSISPVVGEEGELLYYVCVKQDITLEKKQQERLVHLALHDPLTDLPNRMLLMDRLGHALRHTERSGLSTAVLFIDLDAFKPINDSLGHEAGDAVLKTVAQRIRAVVRAEDTAGRLGGDEFMVIMTDLKGREEVAGVARRLLDSLAEPIRLGEESPRVRASIGIAISQADGTDVDKLVGAADKAMYCAKKAGGSGACYAGEPQPFLQTRPEQEA